jgi:hypothetical protein
MLITENKIVEMTWKLIRDFRVVSPMSAFSDLAFGDEHIDRLIL